jgi:hypothetical protein
MCSPISAFETQIEVGMANRNRASLSIGFEADGTNLLSAPGSQFRERIPSLLVECEIH